MNFKTNVNLKKILWNKWKPLLQGSHLRFGTWEGEIVGKSISRGESSDGFYTKEVRLVYSFQNTVIDYWSRFRMNLHKNEWLIVNFYLEKVHCGVERTKF